VEHRIVTALIEDAAHVRLVGCGGNGSQMLTGLARLDHAIRALGHPGIVVTAHDPDEVSPANIGRQMFSPGDVGRNKAVVLVNRLNQFFGTAWDAVPAPWRYSDKSCQIVISCVDTRSARAQINQALTQCIGGMGGRRGPHYWMDLGNRAEDGQVVLGQPAQSEKFRRDKNRLPTVAELFPEIVKPGREDNTPSCSLAEALEKQHLFVNQAVSTAAMQILWQLFRFGKIDWHGAFVNLKSGRTTPLPVDPATWDRMRGIPSSKSTRSKPTRRTP
jgi:PRTRC genetic system ThiF family protein